MKELESLSKTELKTTLGQLKMYSNMTKQLGRRWKKLFAKVLSGKKEYKVEYFSALGEESAWNQAQQVFSKSFHVSPKREEVDFFQNDETKGGMKVFVDDNMVDVSFDKVEKLMQK